MFKKFVFILCILSVATFGFARNLRVVATLPELGSIAEDIGGSRVNVTSLISGTQDAHYVEPRPSMVVRLRNADLLIVNGMELDIWIDSLIDVARNRDIVHGRQGYLDISREIDPKLEVLPAGTRIDGSMGHVHAAGNPHFILCPENAKTVARQIADRLSVRSPDNRAYFQNNYQSFAKRIDENMKVWRKTLKDADIDKMVTYHKNWAYFARTFDIEVLGELEPLPGVPPTPVHLSRMVQLIQDENVPVVVAVLFYDTRPTRFINDRTGVRIARVPMAVGGSPEATDYFRLMDTIVNTIAGK